VYTITLQNMNLCRGTSNIEDVYNEYMHVSVRTYIQLCRLLLFLMMTIILVLFSFRHIYHNKLAPLAAATQSRVSFIVFIIMIPVISPVTVHYIIGVKPIDMHS